MKSLFEKAVAAIEERGAILVFPINNRKEIPSLWSAFHPRSPMKWEWDEDGDDRVAKLWHLRAELSESSEVVYSKWFRGRATFFSRDFFTHLLASRNSIAQASHSAIRLSRASLSVLEALETSSPLSTKQLKMAAELVGRENEANYNHALKPLWLSGLIVAFGEVDDSSFPSLAIGATKLIFEDLWLKAKKTKPSESDKWIRSKLKSNPEFLKFYEKLSS